MKYIIIDDSKDKITIKRCECDIMIVENPYDECKDFIEKNLDEIVPFRVNKGYVFQVRFDKDEFEVLPDFLKNIFKSNVNYFDIDDPEDYKKTFFWKPCKSYIFKYKIDKCIYIEAKILERYGYYAVDKEYFFLKRHYFHDLILFNLGKFERDPLRIPKSLMPQIKEKSPEFYLKILRQL